jgi:hypothetical protein
MALKASSGSSYSSLLPGCVSLSRFSALSTHLGAKTLCRIAPNRASETGGRPASGLLVLEKSSRRCPEEGVFHTQELSTSTGAPLRNSLLFVRAPMSCRVALYAARGAHRKRLKVPLCDVFMCG